MIDLYKSSILNQYEAALRMLDECIERCPDESWNAPVANNPFCQAVFHALFFTDLYLHPNVDTLQDQPFHKEHPDFFRDYEETLDKLNTSTKPTLRLYIRHRPPSHYVVEPPKRPTSSFGPTTVALPRRPPHHPPAPNSTSTTSDTSTTTPPSSASDSASTPATASPGTSQAGLQTAPNREAP